MEELLILLLTDEDIDKYLNEINIYKEQVKNIKSLYNKLLVLEDKLYKEKTERNKKVK